MSQIKRNPFFIPGGGQPASRYAHRMRPFVGAGTYASVQDAAIAAAIQHAAAAQMGAPIVAQNLAQASQQQAMRDANAINRAVAVSQALGLPAPGSPAMGSLLPGLNVQDQANAVIQAASQLGMPDAALQGAQGASLQQNGPTQGRRQNLGFPTTVVNIGATSAAITSQPQVWFRPDRLFIASSIVGKFTIQSVEIGNKKQFLNDNPCPASMFSELAVDSYVEYDTCEPAISIAVIATNTDSVTNSITPGMTGRSAY